VPAGAAAGLELQLAERQIELVVNDEHVGFAGTL